MNQIWVAGEVLIDLIPAGDKKIAVVGGGPANTAKALSRLGINTQFIDGVSTDQYGQMIKTDLVADQVLLDYVKFSEKPTCQAIVTLSQGGVATYEFVVENTATFDFQSDWLPDPALYKSALLHIGTLATIIEPGASVLFSWAKDVAKHVPIVFDPNIRPAVLNNRIQYLSQVQKWVSISKCVKVSEDDLNWLYPDQKIDVVVNMWLNMGPELIVVTLGSEGLTGYRINEKINIGAIKVDVVDTVGAGDTVGAVLVEAIVSHGLDKLTGPLLETTLKRAAKAAAITVSRVGANPPYAKELE